MRKQWSCVFVALGMAATTILGAQGNPSPANNPPPDAAAPPGVQRQTLPPPAEAKANTVMISGCIQDAPMAAAGVTTAAPVVACISSRSNVSRYFVSVPRVVSSFVKL